MQGKLGVDLARQHRPDLILLDLHLPDLHGREVLQQLKRDPATAAIPVIVLSADATPAQVERLRAAGAADYATKPIDLEWLLDTVTAVPPTHATR
jgi:CheY-like chemotaxis protein